MVANLYRFSPVKSKGEFDAALEYIATEMKSLARRVTGKDLGIDTLKFFPHYFDEYEYLIELLASYGPKSDFSSATSLYVEANLRVKEQSVRYLGVRIVDPYRFQVGCGDYRVDNYEQFREEFLKPENPYVREIVTDRLTMIELWHPEFDVLGYVVKEAA